MPENDSMLSDSERFHGPGSEAATRRPFDLRNATGQRQFAAKAVVIHGHSRRKPDAATQRSKHQRSP